MKRLKKILIDLCTDERVELKIRLFRVVMLLGINAYLIATIYNIFVLRAELVVSLFTLAGVVELAIAFGFTLKLKDCRNLFTGFLLLNDVVIYPAAFIQSGGVESGTPIWLMFGLVLVFIFLDGWRFYLTLAASILSVLVTYAVCGLHPEIVRPLNSHTAAVIDSCTALLLIGIISGLIFRFEAEVYERKQALTREQHETIKKISDSRNLFFANMSHEIRTPINTILGLNEMTLREDISDEVAENSMNIQTAGKLLLALINDILDLSKLESGKMELTPAQYETSALFSDLVNIIWIRAHEKNLGFHVDIAEDIPSVLYGDEMRIKQILINLLNNAVKYTKEGSVSLTVKGERTEVNRIRLRISVKDTGIGIRSEDLSNLFSDYQRIDEKNNYKIEGTGLGLSIVKQLVKLMDGTITVNSIYTKGSSFNVTLDQQIVSEEPIGSMRSAVMHRMKERPQYNCRFEAPEAKVLIVDDNEMNLLVATKLLRDTRVQVDTASSGKECLQKTMEQFYHVIFMDHVMPDMDGEETLKALRGSGEGFCQGTPVVALTANVMSNAQDYYREKGFDGYLAKPINSTAFEAILQSFLPEELIEYTASSSEESDIDRISAVMIHGKQKKAVRITTDSVCDLPQELLDKYDIKVMKYYVSTKNGCFQDTTEITTDALLEYMGKGNEAHSSPASVQEYEEFFADNLMDAEHVIHISMSSHVSDGFDVATKAARGFDNVMVVDSGHLSSGLGLIVLQAAKMAGRENTVQQIEEEIERLREKVSTSFIVTSLDNLYSSGRMSYKSYMFCRSLRLHPEIDMRRGRMLPLRIFAGGKTSVSRRYIRRQLRIRRQVDDSILFITYTGCTLAQLEKIRAEAERYVAFQEVHIQKATAAIATNCGKGTFGLLFVKK